MEIMREEKIKKKKCVNWESGEFESVLGVHELDWFKSKVKSNSN